MSTTKTRKKKKRRSQLSPAHQRMLKAKTEHDRKRDGWGPSYDYAVELAVHDLRQALLPATPWPLQAGVVGKVWTRAAPDRGVEGYVWVEPWAAGVSSLVLPRAREHANSVAPRMVRVLAHAMHVHLARLALMAGGNDPGTTGSAADPLFVAHDYLAAAWMDGG